MMHNGNTNPIERAQNLLDFFLDALVDYRELKLELSDWLEGWKYDKADGALPAFIVCRDKHSFVRLDGLGEFSGVSGNPLDGTRMNHDHAVALAAKINSDPDATTFFALSLEEAVEGCLANLNRMIPDTGDLLVRLEEQLVEALSQLSLEELQGSREELIQWIQESEEQVGEMMSQAASETALYGDSAPGSALDISLANQGVSRLEKRLAYLDQVIESKKELVHE